jgi:hypothetical protein
LKFVNVEFFKTLPLFPKLLDFHLDITASTIDGKWLFVLDEGLRAKIKGFGEEGSNYDSGSNRADAIELWDSDDEDGPLIDRMDWLNHFRTMPNPKTVPSFLINAINWVQTSPRSRKFISRHRTNLQDSHLC